MLRKIGAGKGYAYILRGAKTADLAFVKAAIAAPSFFWIRIIAGVHGTYGSNSFSQVAFHSAVMMAIPAFLSHFLLALILCNVRSRLGGSLSTENR